MAADIDHLHVKRIHLVSFFYIVIEDKFLSFCWDDELKLSSLVSFVGDTGRRPPKVASTKLHPALNFTEIVYSFYPSFRWYISHVTGAMVKEEGRGQLTLLVKAWLGWKIEGHTAMVVTPEGITTPKVGSRRCRKMGTRVESRLVRHINNINHEWL
jgi:hypothetical protein